MIVICAGKITSSHRRRDVLVFPLRRRLSQRQPSQRQLPQHFRRHTFHVPQHGVERPPVVLTHGRRESGVRLGLVSKIGLTL